MKDFEKYYVMPDPGNHSIFYHTDLDDESYEIDLQQHDAWEVMYIPNGHGVRIVDGMEEPFRQGEVVLLPPSVSHCWKYDKETEGKPQHIMVAFTQQTLLQAMDTFPELKRIFSNIVFPSTAQRLFHAEGIRKTLRNMSGKSSYAQLLMFLEILPLIFMTRSVPISGKLLKDDSDKQKIVTVKSYVYKFFPTKITLADIAAQVGMGQTVFCRFFKKQTGKTFYDYLTRLRIDMACNMLEHTDRGIAEVCYAVGFNDVPHFNRTFKKLKGITPKQMRTEAQAMGAIKAE